MAVKQSHHETSWEGREVLSVLERSGVSWNVVLSSSGLEGGCRNELEDRCLVCAEYKHPKFPTQEKGFICSQRCLLNEWADYIEYAKQSGKNTIVKYTFNRDTFSMIWLFHKSCVTLPFTSLYLPRELASDVSGVGRGKNWGRG